MATLLTRKIVHIDESKCDGCGECVPNCAEGAIKIIDGKARLVSDIYCDGLGACLGVCPTGAITIEERPAEAFDAAAVEAQQREAGSGGCPGAAFRELNVISETPGAPAAKRAQAPSKPAPGDSRLSHWPIQLTLVPPNGPIWENADVLIAADCVAFAMPDFHERLLKGKSLAMACPKLDDVGPYLQKLTHIFSTNSIRSVTVAHMEVPCCTGIVRLVEAALSEAGKTDLPLQNVTIGVQGEVIS